MMGEGDEGREGSESRERGSRNEMAPEGMADLAMAVPAAGGGSRMGGVRKAGIHLLGEPLLLHALRPLLAHPRVGKIAVALHPEEAGDPPTWLRELGDARLMVVAGGDTRGASVKAALAALEPLPDFVGVHDGARPLVDREVLDRCLQVAEGGRGGVAGWRVVDTLKETDAEGLVIDTPDRSRLWRAQTPQIFPGSWLRRAYWEEGASVSRATDDASLVSALGLPVEMVEGGAWNLKVTHPDDVAVAEHLLRRPDGGASVR